MRVNFSDFLYRIWLFLTVITVLYSFFFQYGVISINGLMMILCVLIIACSLLHIIVCDNGILYKNYLLRPFILFVFFAVTSTYFTSRGNYGSNQSIRLIEYIMVAYSIYILFTRCPKYFEVMMWSFVIAISLLSITIIKSGVVSTAGGGIGLTSININTASSYILFSLFASFYLIAKKPKRICIIILILLDVISIIALIDGASRRGFVVGALMVIMSVFWGLIPANSEKKSYKRFTLSVIAIIAFGVLYYFAIDYILNNTSLGLRLIGINNSGDILREKYQTFAIQCFFDNPVFGIGLGGVEYSMGAYSHSFYYETLACTGIISSICLYYGIIKFGVDLFKQRRICIINGDNNNEAIIMLTSIFLLSLIISGIAVVMIYEIYFYMAMSIIAIIITNTSNSICNNSFN